MAENAELARYKPVLDRMRAMKPYQLSDELERFLHDTSVVGASAWNRLFDETMAGLTFDVDGEALGIEATLNLLTEQDRAKREAGGAGAGRHVRGRACRSSRGCTTLWPRKRRSRIAGASCRRRKPPATSPTTWSPRSSRPCATPSSRPIRACRIAITRSRPSGWDWTRCRSGTVTRLCRWKRPASCPGTRRARWSPTPMRASIRGWRNWPSPSSPAAGSTLASRRGRPPVPSPIPPSPTCIPT